jgi:hypothetical protein
MFTAGSTLACVFCVLGVPFELVYTRLFGPNAIATIPHGVDHGDDLAGAEMAGPLELSPSEVGTHPRVYK